VRASGVGGSRVGVPHRTQERRYSKVLHFKVLVADSVKLQAIVGYRGWLQGGTLAKSFMKEHRWKVVGFLSSFSMQFSRWALTKHYHKEEWFLHEWVTQVWKRLRAVMKTAVVEVIQKAICRMTKKEKEAPAFTVMIDYLDCFRNMECLKKACSSRPQGQKLSKFLFLRNWIIQESEKRDKTNPTSLPRCHVHPGTRP
jgi:hypothetical protein